MSISARQIFSGIFITCAALLATGLYLQHVQNLEPCPLCILQRYAFILCGALAGLAALHHPQAYGKRIYGAVIALIALAGMGIAGRQIWLQLNPQPATSCGPDLAYMMNSFPLNQALPMLFRGEGDCAKIDWSFLGLSIAQWSFIWLAAIATAALWVTFSRRRKKTF